MRVGVPGAETSASARSSESVSSGQRRSSPAFRVPLYNTGRDLGSLRKGSGSDSAFPSPRSSPAQPSQAPPPAVPFTLPPSTYCLSPPETVGPCQLQRLASARKADRKAKLGLEAETESSEEDYAVPPDAEEEVSPVEILDDGDAFPHPSAHHHVP